MRERHREGEGKRDIERQGETHTPTQPDKHMRMCCAVLIKQLNKFRSNQVFNYSQTG